MSGQWSLSTLMLGYTTPGLPDMHTVHSKSYLNLVHFQHNQVFKTQQKGNHRPLKKSSFELLKALDDIFYEL